LIADQHLDMTAYDKRQSVDPNTTNNTLKEKIDLESYSKSAKSLDPDATTHFLTRPTKTVRQKN